MTVTNLFSQHLCPRCQKPKPASKEHLGGFEQYVVCPPCHQASMPNVLAQIMYGALCVNKDILGPMPPYEKCSDALEQAARQILSAK